MLFSCTIWMLLRVVFFLSLLRGGVATIPFAGIFFVISIFSAQEVLPQYQDPVQGGLSRYQDLVQEILSRCHFHVSSSFVA